MYKGDEKISEQKEQRLLSYGEISIFLRDYEEIFSDFDPRSYSQRSFSFDFIDEMKRALRDVDPRGFELRFLMPRAKRNVEKEELIKRRIADHTRKHREILEDKRRSMVKQGFSFFLIGIILMLWGAYILFYNGEARSFWRQFLVVLLEPGGWFLFWEGLDLVVFESKKISADLDFYRKLTKANLIFSHY